MATQDASQAASTEAAADTTPAPDAQPSADPPPSDGGGISPVEVGAIGATVAAAGAVAKGILIAKESADAAKGAASTAAPAKPLDSENVEE